MRQRDPAAARRPHLVVMVDNPVIGDSRMLKTADSAFNAGYDVTLLGLAKRTPPAGRHGPVPLYRVTVPAHRHHGHQSGQRLRERLGDVLPASPWPTQLPARAVNRMAAWAVRGVGGRTPLRSRARSLSRHIERPRLARGFRAQLEFLYEGPLDEETARTAAAEWNPDVLVDGRYRWLWPHMEDVEQAFVEALLDLDPDLIHAADRFCLVAAATYAGVRQAEGRPVRWIYDAHEWIPGQTLHGAPYAKTAWLAAEHELAPRADGVIAVSEELADRMRARHGLRERPTVVLNAPVSTRVAMDPAERRPLREEVGLEPEVPLLVYVGKLSELRGVLTTVQALPLLPGVHAAFVGSQDRIRADLQSLAEELGVADRVHLLDYVPAGCVTWYIASADIGLSPLLPTAAHHAALPTKIRECLQAGLPLVVSDMRAQGSFVRETGVGAVHRPGDPRSLAEAARTVLDDLAAYRGAITQELLAEHTWEGQERRLVALWRSLVPTTGTAAGHVLPGERPEDLRTPGHDPASVGIVGPTTAVSTPLQAALEATGQRAHRVGPASEPVVDPSASTGQIRASLVHWLRLQDGPRRLIYTEPAPHCPLIHRRLFTEVTALRAMGHNVAVLLEPLTHVRPEDLFAAVPGHPLDERAEEVRARYARQVRRNRAQLEDLDATLLTTGLNAAGLLPRAVWLPFPVAPTTQSGPGTATLRVLVAPGPRTPSEQQHVEALVARLAHDPAVRVTRMDVTRGGPAPDLAGHHLVLDPLTLGEHSPTAAQAMAHGAVVVSGARSQVAAGVLAQHLDAVQLDPALLSRVLLAAASQDVDETVAGALAHLSREAADGSGETADLARRVASQLHGAQSVRLAVERALGPSPT